MWAQDKIGIGNMQHPLVAIVSLVALLVYFTMSARVGRGRIKYGVAAPAVTGNPDFERDYRIQMNTLEWLPLFLVSLWLFAFAWNDDRIAAAVGAVWIVGRILYLTGYSKAAESRGPGFAVQALATAVLLFGALGRLVWQVIQHGV
jgi:glutathione S-transferase